MADTKKCTPAMRAGRLSKADQFLTAAELIASSIEDSELNEHSTGGNHKAAVAFLARVDKANSVHLATLLDMKGHAGYSAMPTSVEYQESARVAAQTLVDAAKLV